jgi:hypothetical protein
MGGLEKDAKRTVKQAKGTSSKFAGGMKTLGGKKKARLRSQQGQEGDRRALEVTSRRVHEAAAGVVAEIRRLLLGPSATIRGEGTRRRRLKRAQLFRTEAFGAEAFGAE